MITISVLTVVICSVVAVTWFALFLWEYPYVDLWMYGKTQEEIIEVYGEPEHIDYDEMAYATNYKTLIPFAGYKRF